MADVDLIPSDYLKAQLVRLRVSQFAIAFISVVVVIGVTYLGLNAAMSLERSSIVRLEKERRISTQNKVEADNYRQQTLLVEKQLTELDELRGHNKLRMLLMAIDSAYNDNVWLDELHFFRSDLTPARIMNSLPAPSHSESTVTLPQALPLSGETLLLADIEQRVKIVGHATNHTQLASFMRTLSSQPGIAEVRLMDTGLGSHSNSPVIDLTLMLLVDDKKRSLQ